jgi:fumarylacetoacetate (FAA) hydrolase family protein
MASRLSLSARECLPRDAPEALLVGRAWVPAEDGPSVIAVRGDDAVDLTRVCPTASHLLNAAKPADVRAMIRTAPSLRPLEEIVANSVEGHRDPAKPWLLAPCDLQAVKASGVTFVASMLERVIEERARGNPALADGARREIQAIIGPDLRGIQPGSPEAARVKEVLVGRCMWSPYLEVGIGPDAELFTKCPPMAAVGPGARVGIHPASVWSNPEPELVLAISQAGTIAAVTLGNDVNLRDVEGRSALLLGRAKDNNASCAIGPFFRLLDDGFPLERARQLGFQTVIEGLDGFRVTHVTRVSEISRDLADWPPRPSGPSTGIPTGSSSSSAPCSRPRPIGEARGAGSPTRWATWSRSPRPSSGPSSTRSCTATRPSRGPSGPGL